MSTSHIASKSSLRILWVGPVIEERHFDNPAVSAAASVWQQGLIQSLIEQLPSKYLGAANFDGEISHLDTEISIELISHLPCQSFPRGVFWPPSDATLFPEGFKGYGVSYCNIPWLRVWMLRGMYSRKIGQVLAASINHPIDLLVSYNAENYVSTSVAKWAKKRSLPWVSIVADLPKIQPQAFLKNAKVADADGRLFLSWKNFQDFAKPHDDLFLEGGVSSFKELTRSASGENILADTQTVSRKRIAYFGGLTTLGGIDLFLQATRHILGSEYEFHIIGAGDAQAVLRVQSFVRADSRIHYHGPASEQALAELGSEMDIFVDPRPRILSENNFPSKLLTYLRFTKPIISTMGHGVPAEYKQVLIHLKQEDPEDLACLIQDVCAWDMARVTHYQLTANEFVFNAKSWQVQGRRVLKWLLAIIQKKNPA